jgi:hypothetical protein
MNVLRALSCLVLRCSVDPGGYVGVVTMVVTVVTSLRLSRPNKTNASPSSWVALETLEMIRSRPKLFLPERMSYSQSNDVQNRETN